VFKDLDFLKKSCEIGVKDTVVRTFRFNNTDNPKQQFHGTVYSHLNGIKSIYVESPQETPLIFKDGSQLSTFQQSHQGLLGIKHVNKHVLANISDADKVVSSKVAIYPSQDIIRFEEDKFICHTALLSSLFESDLIIDSDGLKNGLFYENV
jgi:hypothetical protein